MTIAVFSALISAGSAMFWRERPMAADLNSWDEAAVFLAIGLAAHQLL
jgi:hypothetical protein